MTQSGPAAGARPQRLTLHARSCRNRSQHVDVRQRHGAGGCDFELGAEVTGRLVRCPEGHRSVGGAVLAFCIVRPLVAPDLVRLSDELRAGVAIGRHPSEESRPAAGRQLVHGRPQHGSVSFGDLAHLTERTCGPRWTSGSAADSVIHMSPMLSMRLGSGSSGLGERPFSRRRIRSQGPARQSRYRALPTGWAAACTLPPFRICGRCWMSAACDMPHWTFCGGCRRRNAVSRSCRSGAWAGCGRIPNRAASGGAQAGPSTRAISARIRVKRSSAASAESRCSAASAAMGAP